MRLYLYIVIIVSITKYKIIIITICLNTIRPNKINYLILRPFLSKSDEGMRFFFKNFIEVKIDEGNGFFFFFFFFFKRQYMILGFFIFLL